MKSFSPRVSLASRSGSAVKCNDDMVSASGRSSRPHPTADDQRGVNVKVIVRCRPTSELEKKDPCQYQVISARVPSKEIFVSQTIPGRKVESYSKTYTFDGVCNQYTSQEDLFRIYVVPIVEEVLQGFNCTIFAYGQTGTGKTYTMEGDFYTRMAHVISSSSTAGSLLARGTTGAVVSPSASQAVGGPPILTEHAGIIPRAVQYIFEKLEGQDAEYSVRVSYLEIYNEELNDLLNDGEKQNLRIYEDPGVKRGLAVDRLEEVPVNNPQDILNILSIAVKKRRTAETLLNRQSSRSHCIFSVTIHMKETNIDGEDVIKIGKLNLVDLAGSENIQRSGANTIKDRAKEAGMINQSLLTLGRVINALVEHASYVPYRDSKLTRLLQDSLGGRTKTCIVATVSPSSLCLEETLSTLDYAFRAKNIRNRPEINQRMTKRVMIRELNQEIERLKVELQANREKNGVYLPFERFSEMEAQLSSTGSELTDATSEIKRLKDENTKTLNELAETQQQLRSERKMHMETRQELQEAQAGIKALSEQLQSTKDQLLEEQRLNQELRYVEATLRQQCTTLISRLNMAHMDLDAFREHLAVTRRHGTDIFNSTTSYLERLLNTIFQDIEKPTHELFDEWCRCCDYLKSDVIRRCTEEQTTLKAELTEVASAMRALWDVTASSFATICHETSLSVKDRLQSVLSTVRQHLQRVQHQLYEDLSSIELDCDKLSAEVSTVVQLIHDAYTSTLTLCNQHKQALESAIQGVVQTAIPQVVHTVESNATTTSQRLTSLDTQLGTFGEQHEKLQASFLDLFRSFSRDVEQLLASQHTETQKTTQVIQADVEQLKHASQRTIGDIQGLLDTTVTKPLQAVAKDVGSGFDDVCRSLKTTTMAAVEGHASSMVNAIQTLRERAQQGVDAQKNLLNETETTTEALNDVQSSLASALNTLDENMSCGRTKAAVELQQFSEKGQRSLDTMGATSATMLARLGDLKGATEACQLRFFESVKTVQRENSEMHSSLTEASTAFLPRGDSPSPRSLSPSLQALPLQPSADFSEEATQDDEPEDEEPSSPENEICRSVTVETGFHAVAIEPSLPVIASITSAQDSLRSPSRDHPNGRVLIRSVSRSTRRSSSVTRTLMPNERRREKRLVGRVTGSQSFALTPSEANGSVETLFSDKMPAAALSPDDEDSTTSHLTRTRDLPSLLQSEEDSHVHQSAEPQELRQDALAPPLDVGAPKSELNSFQRPTRIHQLQVRKKHVVSPDVQIDKQKRRRAASRDSRVSS